MSEVKRFDVRSLRSLIQGEQAVIGYEVVLASDYDALAAEAQALREEVAALRARVAVVPERKLLNAVVPGLNRNSGWNACLDELARINGMTVSEGLLRLALEFIMATNCQGSIPLGLIEELRALLNQDKENGDHAA
ncbi:hypothetical protein [Pseudomonas aeruginosa]|uniref:hypothetical protein n=1 Tax=Pseudomonas aeruginosa TaxID=287 RepID=UPI002496C7FA|nr:hypothetical protein [Pseudomonas aeruginosa]MDI2409442.1 hypothetical protein [Pseudomonas aeruginosa]